MKSAPKPAAKQPLKTAAKAIPKTIPKPLIKAPEKAKPQPPAPVIALKSGKSAKLLRKSANGSKPASSRTYAEYVPPPPAVATNLKPRKNQAGISSKELEHYRDMLLEKRREIVGDMSSMEREALRTSGSSNLSTLPIHMADMGTDNYEQEFTLGLVEKDRNLLREINDALAKIQNGTFGICEGTGKAIAKPRLEAQPWARFSIEHARQIEKGGMGVR